MRTRPTTLSSGNARLCHRRTSEYRSYFQQRVARILPGGTVTVLDSTTKVLEIVREIDVAPRMVVVDPLSNQAVLVSPSITKLVDSSYRVIATLPGGVAAAFSRRGDGVAVLSPAGVDTTINFAGAFAPTALTLKGSPRAITALKAGGYLVLLQVDGQGRVVKISPDGRSEGSVSTASIVGGDLIIFSWILRTPPLGNGGSTTGTIGVELAIGVQDDFGDIGEGE